MTRKTLRPYRVSTQRLAFTLIELLVAIAIIAVLISLLLPALAAARRSGQSVVSLSNLGSHARLLAVYSTDNKEAMLNPFTVKDENGRQTTTHVFIAGHEPSAYLFGGATADHYSYHALSLLLESFTEREARLSGSLVAPGDTTLATQYKTVEAYTWQGGHIGVLPSSYWYPPLFYQTYTRFTTNNRPSPSSSFVRRNRTTDIRFPAQKVLLFEGQDNIEKKQPFFFDPKAKPHVALTDGSARRLNMGTLLKTPTNSAYAVPEGEFASPSGAYLPGEELGSAYNQVKSGPAWFWATRYGIRGRDLP